MVPTTRSWNVSYPLAFRVVVLVRLVVPTWWVVSDFLCDESDDYDGAWLFCTIFVVCVLYII